MKTLYTSPTCGPCKLIKLAIADKYNGDDIVIVDISKEEFPPYIRAIPTLVTEDGKRYTGMKPIKDILELN